MKQEIIDLIRSNKIFNGVNFSELDFSDVAGEMKSVNQGHYIFKKNETAEKIYFLIEGEVNLYGATKKKLLENYFFPCDYFIFSKNYSNSAVARKDSSLVSINIEELENLISQNEKIKENAQSEIYLQIKKEENEIDLKQEPKIIIQKEYEIKYKFDAEKAAFIISNALLQPANLCFQEIKELKNKNSDEELDKSFSRLFNESNLIFQAAHNSKMFLESNEEIEATPQDLNETLESIKNRFEEDYSCSESEIILDLTETCKINIDMKKFYEVIAHIIKNGCEKKDKTIIRVVTKLNKETAEIYITDKGYGISEENRSFLFDPFFTFGKENHLGLGLAIADNIINKHNGKLAIKSSTDEETTFSVSLPRV